MSKPKVHKRMTIGLLMDWAESTYQVKLWSGVEDAAKERDVNIICYVSGALASPANPQKQHDRFFNLINADNVDGLIILTATFTQFIDQSTILNFIGQFSPLPMVSIATPIPGIPSILIDNTQGIRELINHLVSVHKYRRIAYIAGAEKHSDAQERFSAYTSTLAEVGLAYDPALIVKGDFSMLSGQAAVHELLSRDVPFDVVVSANDQMAIGALAALSEKRINVPADVAVTGFDDIGTYKTMTPSLTTIRQPLYKQGKRAFEVLIDKIEGKKTEERVIIPTTLVLRESCGCFSQVAKDTFIMNYSSTNPANAGADPEHHRRLFTEMKATLVSSFEILKPLQRKGVEESMEQLFNAFVDEIVAEESGTFLSLWNETLAESIRKGHDISIWRAVLSAFHRFIRVIVSSHFAEQKAEVTINQARKIIVDTEKRIKEYRQPESDYEILAYRKLGEELIITADLKELRHLLAEVLPQFGIKCCYLSLYGTGKEDVRFSQLFLAFDEHGVIQFKSDTERFRETKLVPDGFFPSNRRYTMMVDTLYHMDEQLGFGVLELGPQEGVAYDLMRRRIRNAVKGALLLQQVEGQTIALEKTNRKLQEEMRMRKQIERDILEVSGREQQRIGQDLHDDLGQKLTGIAFMCRVLEEKLNKRSMEEASDAAEITRLIDESIAQTKRLARGLVPVALEENGLVSALEELATKIENSSGITCTFDYSEDVFVRDNSVALHLFRIAQEAVHNSVKHASPNKITIALRIRDGVRLHLTVSDDGIGMPKTSKHTRGIGLHIMNYRANIIDATIDFRNRDGNGTVVDCSLPLSRVDRRSKYRPKKQEHQ